MTLAIVHIGQGRTIAHAVFMAPDPTLARPAKAQEHPAPRQPLKSVRSLPRPAGAPLGSPCHIEDATGCRWPIRRHKDRHLFCNDRTGPGKPYCPEHQRMAWTGRHR